MAFPKFNTRLFKGWVESLGLLEKSEKGKCGIHLFVCLFVFYIYCKTVSYNLLIV